MGSSLGRASHQSSAAARPRRPVSARWAGGWALAAAFGVWLAAGAAGAESPEELGTRVARVVEAANDGYQGQTSTIEMVLINAHGDRTTRRLEQRLLEVDGDGDRSLIEFASPSDVKGTRLLTWSHKRSDDDQWLFLPAINRVKRISSANRSGSFMGSEFSYEDLSSAEVEKYKHELLGEQVVDGRKAWKLRRIPLDAESGYSKLEELVDQAYKAPLVIEYFDRKGELLKTATFSAYEKHGSWYRAGMIVMVNHQTKKESHLSMSDYQMGVSLRERDFNSDRLGQ
jgi:hypothetical protein